VGAVRKIRAGLACAGLALVVLGAGLAGCAPIRYFGTPQTFFDFKDVYVVEYAYNNPEYREPTAADRAAGRDKTMNRGYAILDPKTNTLYNAEPVYNADGSIARFKLTPGGQKEKDDYDRQRLGFVPHERENGGGGGDGGGGGGGD
jgi:hypothetical protein